MQPLEDAASRQAVFSQTADALKKRVDTIRSVTLALSVVGASAAGLAAALSQEGPLRTVLTIAGALCLFAASALTATFLGAEARRRPVRFRAGSETLKHEIYLYAAGGGAYGGGDPDKRLRDVVDQVDSGLTELNLYLEKPKRPGSCPTERFPDLDSYREKRLKGQIDYYADRAPRYSRSAKRFHFAAWLFSFVAGAITAVSGMVEISGFDLAAFTGILTTVAAALLSHVQAQKFDELVISFRSAGRALERLNNGIGPQDTLASVAERTEAIVSEETGSWRSMFLQDSTPAQP